MMVWWNGRFRKADWKFRVVVLRRISVGVGLSCRSHTLWNGQNPHQVGHVPYDLLSLCMAACLTWRICCSMG